MWAVVLAAWLPAAHAENALFQRLLEAGLPADASQQEAVRLPAPVMRDGLDAASQLRVIDESAPAQRRVEDLLRKTVVAPFVLETQEVDAGEDPLWQVDLWYIAYGSLDLFFQESFVEQLLRVAGGERRSGLPLSDKLLTEDDLRQRGISFAETGDVKQRYHASTIALFDRVLLSTTRQIVVSRSAESVVAAAVIDRRFDDDAEYPNQWRSITRSPDGSFVLGEPQPYAVSGMYLKITRLSEPAGALFIEHHQLFAEPHGWFEGRNFLRSKLPLAVQDAVRSLRRQLQKVPQ